jgi:hypothetical protein
MMLGAVSSDVENLLVVFVFALYPLATIGLFAYLFIRRTRREGGWSRAARRERFVGPLTVLFWAALPLAIFVVLWLVSKH